MSATQEEIRRQLIDRIQSGEWSLGSLIPAEADLAREYGCARATMNRALQGLANDGLVVRKRKGGTRISLRPVRHAKVAIPIIRDQVEAMGETYSHHLVALTSKTAPLPIRTRLQLTKSVHALWVETVHKANGQPFALERRWLNQDAVPEINSAPLDDISINEWLVQTVPFSDGDVTFTATKLDASLAKTLGAATGDASFTIERTTWIEQHVITTMTLHYRPGYALKTAL